LYKFVDHLSEEERKRLDCTDTCTYKYAEKSSDQKFCFKPGKYKSNCPERGPVVFQIKIHNELDETVSGGIFYEDNVHHAESYAVKSNETFVDDVVPPEPIIKKITGMTDSGVYCLPYTLPPSGEPKLKFHIVRNETGGCLIIPASVQYHPIKSVKFTENGNDVEQQDFFHPHTREAILKVPAHGRNLDAAIIFQGKRQRSSGSSIMVTATGHECHIHLIPEELDIDPEHMILNNSETQSRSVRVLEGQTKKYHIVKNLLTTRIIAPDDKNVQLTDTMKKECEGKVIYYNDEQDLVEGEYSSSNSVGTVVDTSKKSFKQLLSRKDNRNECNTVKLKYSNQAPSACGIWSYTGINETKPDNLLANPFAFNHLYPGSFQVVAQCCDQPNPPPTMLSCSEIPANATDAGLQAFSTAFHLSWKVRGYECIGNSKFCQWDANARIYDGVEGACVEQCTECCAKEGDWWLGWGASPFPGGCPKRYLWKPSKCNDDCTECPGFTGIQG